MSIAVKTFERLDDAASALSNDSGAHYLAGGTLIMRAVNEGAQSVSTVIRATDGALRQVRAAGGRVEIGAGVTMSQILADRNLDFLHQAARVVGGPAIRSMATVGGNLFARTPFGDFTTALLALDARVVMVGSNEVTLQEFLAKRGSGQAGLVVGVSVERPSDPTAFRFVKVTRVKPRGASVIAIAAYLPLSGGRIGGARIAYGAMAPTPVRMASVERALEAKTLTTEGVAAALAVATEGCAPANDAIASEWYRREVAPVHLKRLLLDRPG